MSRIRNQLLNTLYICLVHNGRLSQTPFLFRRFLRKDMTGKSLFSFYLSCSSQAKSFGRSSVCLNLWHQITPVSLYEYLALKYQSLKILIVFIIFYFLGDIIIIIFLPSSFGYLSMTHVSTSSSFISSMIFLPRSVYTISLPLNIMVIFTLLF